MSQPQGQLAVICQNQKSLRIHVQAANVRQLMEVPGQQMVDGRSRAIVGLGGEVVDWLVKQDVNRFGGTDELTIDLNRGRGLDLATEFRTNGAIDCYSAGKDDLLNGSPGSNPRLC